MTKRSKNAAKLTSAGRCGNVRNPTRQILWARSGGICSFPGCGKVLHRESRYLTPGCFGELAHNVAASEKGPRGDAVRSQLLVDDPDNLIMACPSCHTQIDAGGAELYPEQLLRDWKTAHENTVEMLATIRSNRKARILICTGSIRGRTCDIGEGAAIGATVKSGYLPVGKPSQITLPSFHAVDGTQQWWDGQAHALKRAINTLFNDKREPERTLAIFAVAEMPSLILLGYLLGDEQRLELFQLDRVTGSCEFAEPDGEEAKFTISYPATIGPDGIALVISATAPVDEERVRRASPGKSLAIVEIRAESPSRDLVRSPATVNAFRKIVMDCIDRIEHIAGTKVPIHVFPAMPAPLAVALGATVMPKAPVQFSIYDSSGPDGTFCHSLTLPLSTQ